ncbi:wax synthase family protein [Aspergillus lucknowensis]|uniref:Membrane bound O-acyl transferase family-domain-containing protein n=1 Tax=Aspergillus lucknowensis TaxID=176173 RepID=A0ABR4LV54_9EURO
MAGNPSSIVLENKAALDALYDQGIYCPVLLHHVVLLFTPTIAVLMMRRRSTPCHFYLRVAAFVCTTAIGCWIIKNCRSVYFFNGFVIGIVASSAILRSASMLLFRDPETEFSRIEERSVDERAEKPGEDLETQYVWQPYPEPLWDRLWWVLCAAFSMQSTLFSWGRGRLDADRKRLVARLNDDKTGKPVRVSEFSSPRMSGRRAIGLLLESSLAMECVSICIAGDPYTYGHTSAELEIPATGLTFPAGSPAARIWRTSFCVLRMGVAMIYDMRMFNALLFGLCVLFPHAAYTVFRIQTHMSWMYQDLIGQVDALLDSGLVGAWGTVWNQTYRFDFDSCSRFILSCLSSASAASPALRVTTRAFVSFALSGLIHALASYTQFAEKHAFTGVGWFFVLQAVGVTAQILWTSVVVPKLEQYIHIPRAVGRASNAVFLFFWWYVTGPILFDEYAKGLLFLSAHAPSCLLRSAGVISFSSSVCVEFGGSPMQFWTGTTWWTSGIRIL